MSQVVCRKCGETLTEENHHPSLADRGIKYCKKCWNQRSAEYYADKHRMVKHRGQDQFGQISCRICGEILTEENTYYGQGKICKRCRITTTNNWKLMNPSKVPSHRRIAARNYKIEAFRKIAEYYNKSPDQCWRCGESEHAGHPFIDYGQIDHVMGNASQERKIFKYCSTAYFVATGKRTLDDLQLLCPTCNWIKRSEQNENRGHGQHNV